MEVLMIKCDNPTCKSLGAPEFVPGQYGPKRRGEKVMAPYGWHQGEGFLMGSGPNYAYMACSDSCVGPAIIDKLKRAYEEEQNRD